LRLACEGVFQALFRARAFECCHGYLLDVEKNALTDLSKTNQGYTKVMKAGLHFSISLIEES
jgi:hypothetical protein